MMLGYSVYFSKLDWAYIHKMDELGIKTIFTSLHIPEEQLEHESINKFLADSLLHERDIIIDISNATKKILAIDEYIQLKELGVKTIRIDFGIDDKEIVELQKHFRIILNASTLNQEKINSLKESGLNINEVIAMHNFYPREHTGISPTFFNDRNKIFQQYGIKVWAFIPGNEVLRGPLYKGLPTIEKHRNVLPYISFMDLKENFKIDGIFIGDPQVDYDTLEMINLFDKEGIITLPTTSLSPHIPKNIIYNNRFDESESVVRIEQGRQMFATMEEIYKTTFPEERKMGAITIDNELYQRYKGELQIMKEDLPLDNRVNLVGSVDDNYLGALSYVKSGTKIKFK